MGIPRLKLTLMRLYVPTFADRGARAEMEAGLVLGQLGHTPGDMDYLYFAGQAGMVYRPVNPK